MEQGEVLQDMIPGRVFHGIAEVGHLFIEEQPDLLLDNI